MRFITTLALIGAALPLAACNGGTTTADMGAPLDLGGDSMVGSDAGHDAGRDSGPPVDGGTADPAAWQAALHTDNMQLCACFATMLGYATPADCVTGQDGAPEVVSCQEMAATSTIATSGPVVLCRTAAFTAHASCLMTAACGMAAVNACNTTLNDALTACGDLAMEFFDALNMCGTNSVVGTGADMCSDTMTASMAVGPAALHGSTVGAGDNRAGSCPMGGGGAADVAVRWTAPAAGMYTMDTIGSSFDTVLYILDGCGATATELVCNDDIDTMGGNYRSSLTYTFTAGQTVQIIIDGYDPIAAGSYVVNITPPAGTDAGVVDDGGSDAGTATDAGPDM